MMWDEEEAMEEDDGGGDDGAEDGAEGEEFEWENLYFQAKGTPPTPLEVPYQTCGCVDAMEDDPKAAIKDFEKIVKGEQPPGEWYYHTRGGCVPDLPTP